MRGTGVLLALALSAALVACAPSAAPPEQPPPQPVAAAAPARPVARLPRRGATAAEARPGSVWRVAQDGTTGCADPMRLRELRAVAEDATSRRRLASIRAAGGCVTVFRSLPLRLLEEQQGVMRLAPLAEAPPSAVPAAAPVGPASFPLWFWRDELTAEAAPNS